MDFADQGSEFQELDLQLALRQHASRCQKPMPHPTCEFCEEQDVYVFSNGAKCRYCFDCRTELLLEGVK